PRPGQRYPLITTEDRFSLAVPRRQTNEHSGIDCWARVSVPRKCTQTICLEDGFERPKQNGPPEGGPLEQKTSDRLGSGRGLLAGGSTRLSRSLGGCLEIGRASCR